MTDLSGNDMKTTTSLGTWDFNAVNMDVNPQILQKKASGLYCVLGKCIWPCAQKNCRICFLIGRLCGVVVRDLGYRSRGPGPFSGIF
jgi:hypothetical protein